MVEKDISFDMEKENIIDLRRFWRAVKRLKWLYLAAVLLLGAAGIYLVARMMPKLPIAGEMLVGEESMTDGGAGMLAATAGKGAGGLGQMMKTFSVGGFAASAVDNEVLILGSHDVLKRTVKTLGLNRSYVGKTADGKKALLWRDSPVLVEAPAEYFDTLSVAFSVKIKLLPGGKADLKATKGVLKRTIAQADGVKLPTILKTPCGSIQILRGETFDSSPYHEVSVNVYGNSAAAVSLSKQLDIDVMTKLSDVIEVKLEFANPELGKAIVDGVMAEYNAKRLGRVHETAVNSIKYYDERIAETLKQLETAEQRVAEYQRSTSMSAIEAEAKVIAGLTTEGKANVIKAQHIKNYYERVLASMKNSLDADVLLPQVTSMGDSTIVEYNNLIMRRRDLRRSATDNNTALLLLNQEISTLSDLIKDNARMVIDRAQSEIDLQTGVTGMATNRLNQYPDIEYNYTALARNKEFQNALYLYLVQARENAVLKLYTDTDLGYVFQPAYVQKPGLPLKKILVVVGALFFALVGCSFIALIMMWCQKRVKQPMDLAFMGIEGNALTVTDRDEAAARMRTMMLRNPERRVIYAADFTGGDDAVGMFEKSLEAAGFNVVKYAPDVMDELSNPENSRQLALKAEANTYVMVYVPDVERLFMLEHVIDANDANLLTIVPQSMKRSRLKSLLKGQTAARVFTLIVPADK